MVENQKCLHPRMLDGKCDAADILSKTLAHQQWCKGRLERVLTSSEDGEVSNDELLSALKEAHASLCHMGEDLSDRLPPSYYNSLSPPGGAYNAMKLFGIQEMLEQVMSYLSIGELLCFEQVNKELRDAIRASSALGRQFFLQQPSGDRLPRTLGTVGPYSSEHQSHPVDIYYCNNGDGYRENFDTDRTYLWNSDSQLEVQAKIRGPLEHLPRMGKRGLGRLICNPPIKIMLVVRNCCGGYDEAGILDEDLVQNENGITLGDLYESAVPEIRGHRYCDEDVVVVTFRTLDEENLAALREYQAEADLST